MKKFSKRLFTSLVAFCMLFSVSAVPAFAAETTTEIKMCIRDRAQSGGQGSEK